MRPANLIVGWGWGGGYCVAVIAGTRIMAPPYFFTSDWTNLKISNL